MITCGIVGYGKMGKIRAGVIVPHPDLTLVDVFDVGDDYTKTKVDALFVCTPNNVTPEVVIWALKHGKHVFCEKPPGRTLEDIRNILKAESGTVLKFGFNHRYHGAIIEAKRIIDSGQLGKMLWMRGIYGKAGATGWRNDKEIAGGGILLDQGIHMVDLFRLFCGDFQDVKSFLTGGLVEDNAFALLRNNKGQVAMLHSSSTHWKHQFSLDIFLEGGYLLISGILSSTKRYGPGEKLIIAQKQEGIEFGNPKEHTLYFNEDNSWKLEVDDFVDCIKNHKKVEVGNSIDAYKAMELVTRIYESSNRP